MGFLKHPLGATASALAAAALVACGAVGILFHRSTHPPTAAIDDADFDSVILRVEPVSFPATDGAILKGRWFAGRDGAPTVVLCHDWGRSKESLSHLAVQLQDAGFNVLNFDLRGHGESERRASTFGVAETRDVLGAIDWVRQRRGNPSGAAARIGVYGVGIGAFAALEAADERNDVRAVVLDGLYPDTDTALLRHVYAGSDFAEDWFGFLPRAMFRVAHGDPVQASSALSRMHGRNVLMLASDGDGELAFAAQRLVAAIPEGIDADGSLVILPATQSEGLFGDELEDYQQRVSEFFTTRLKLRS